MGNWANVIFLFFFQFFCSLLNCNCYRVTKQTKIEHNDPWDKAGLTKLQKIKERVENTETMTKNSYMSTENSK